MIIRYLFIIIAMLVLSSCTKIEDGGPIYLKALQDGTECQLWCIGERNFPNTGTAVWSGLEDDPKRKNAKGKVKGYNGFKYYRPCIIARYAWDAFNQKEIDYGMQICSAQALGFWDNYGINHYDCAKFDPNQDEKQQMRASLKRCEAKRYYTQKKTYSKKTYSTTKTKKQKEKDEQQQKVNNAKKTCRDLGFTNQQDLADCGLKILTTEKDLNTNVSSNNSNEALARQMRLNSSIQLMQQGLKLMQPPKQNSVNCRWTLLGWTCN